jgi:hypothetical protein
MLSPQMKAPETIYREELSDPFDKFWSDVCVIVEKGGNEVEKAIMSRTSQLVEDLRQLANAKRIQWEECHFEVSSQALHGIQS